MAFRERTRNMDDTESRMSVVTNVAQVEAGISKQGADVKVEN